MHLSFGADFIGAPAFATPLNFCSNGLAVLFEVILYCLSDQQRNRHTAALLS